MNSVLSLPLLFGDNRLLPAGVGEKLELPGSILFALFLGTVISLLAVFILMIWKQLKLDGGQYLLWSLVGAILLSPVIYFVFLSPPAGVDILGYHPLDWLRLSEKSRDAFDLRKVTGVVYIPIVLFVASFVLGVLIGRWLRLKEMGWRFGLIIGSCIAASAIIVLGEFKLGVDLQGGVILVYEVDEEQSDKLLPAEEKGQYAERMQAVAEKLKRRLNPDGLKELVIRVSGPRQIEIVVPEVDAAEISRLKTLITTGGVLQFLILADNPQLDRELHDLAKEQAASRNSTVKVDDRVRDKEGKKIVGRWKGVARENEGDETSSYRDLSITNPGVLLRDSATGDLIQFTDRERVSIQSDPKVNLPAVLAERKIKSIETLLRYDEALDITGDDLKYSEVGKDEDGSPCIHFTMKANGSVKMGQLTQTFRQRKLSIVFDNNLVSAPVIQSQITSQGRITGRFSLKEVNFMVELLKSGSMPVVLKNAPISENRIGSLLGLDTIKKGSWSIVISLTVVLVFTAVYYRFAGLVACVALILNIVLTVAIMVMLQAPFTLPGLAGIVLTVGMSVDSNVLIFERIREELAKGAALRMALRNGFDRAMTTIIDSNLTTLLTAVVLYAIGTDQVRGFGITLTLGILTSMFTAIFCARTIFEAGERLKRLKTLSMMKFFTRTNIDWCKWFPVATIGSVILIAIGLVATVARGMGIFDTDLAGGTSVVFVLKEKMTDQEVRQTLGEKFATLKDAQTGSRIDFTVYEMDFSGQEKQTVYKVDSNIPDDKLLQKAVQEAFRRSDGTEGLQTHKLVIGNVQTVSRAASAAEAGVIPGGPGPFEDAPREPEPPARTTPKSEPEKASSGNDKKAASEESDEKKSPQEPGPAKTDEKKSDEKKSDEKKADDTPQDSPAESAAKDKPCGVQEETKDEVSTKETKPAEAPESEKARPAEAKSTEPKTDETRSAESKSEPETKAPPPTPPTTAKATPTEPPTPSEAGKQFHETTADLTFPGNKISGGELKTLLENTVQKSLSQNQNVKVSRMDETTGRPWDGKDSSAHENWTVTLPLPEAQAQVVFGELKTTLESSPVWQSSNKIEGQVTVDTQLKALSAILLSLLGIVAYVWFRFQSLSWGIAAVVALVHDTLVMLGFIAMSYWMAGVLGFLQVEEFKISLTIVAAFLTLIGYSINDTIVIFDRIREIRGKSPDLTRHMINESVNQTMSRTILTTGTVLMVVVVLYFAGGSGIHAFAFSMIVGALAGTYSTVFIAAPLLLLLHNKPGTAGKGAVKPAPAPAR
jgi:SecD/SecF fusion protein